MSLPKPCYEDSHCTLYVGDALDVLRQLPDASVQTCVTSPPYYGLRDYGSPGQLGLEATPDEYVANMVAVFREVRRVLRDDGTCWLNLGDSYVSSPRGNKNGWQGSGLHGVESQTYQDTLNAGTAQTLDKTGIPGLKPKDLIGIPWRVAFALQQNGWTLRSDIIWAKPNPMPESVTDRPTKAHEYVFLLSKSKSYYYDADAIREPHTIDSFARIERGHHRNGHKWQTGPGSQTLANNLTHALHPNGRNRRSVWTVSTQPYSGAHFAVFPAKLIEPCILAGAPEGGVVLDPFIGSGTTAVVAKRLGRRCIGIDLSETYLCELAIPRLYQQALPMEVS